MTTAEKQSPTILVVLGATGDLMAKKILPALFHQHCEGNLPKQFILLGVSRRDWDDAALRNHVAEILKTKAPDVPATDIEKFLELVRYHRLEFHNREDYDALSAALKKMDDEWKVCTNKLFYLSVPPEFYADIFENIHAAHLADECGDNGEGWTRIIVEKPFGNDEPSAKALDEHLARLFEENQIYRIDHYLAKEAFQNMIAFRFSNNLFENQWGSKLIERITAREYETVGVEDRGAFYDKVGALRDVGQNHLLQMIALATMDQPQSITAEAVRAARATMIETFMPLTKDDVRKKTFRAQYDGYPDIKGVAPDSETETYFRAEFSSSHKKWADVEFVIEAGKLLGPKGSDETTEIEILFKHPEPCLCPPGVHYKNKLIFRQDPVEGITLFFWAKKVNSTELERRSFEFDLHTQKTKAQYVADYGKLLMDCIVGDQTLFVSSREIRAMWRFIDPIIEGWQSGAVPLKTYQPGTTGIIWG